MAQSDSRPDREVRSARDPIANSLHPSSREGLLSAGWRNCVVSSRSQLGQAFNDLTWHVEWTAQISALLPGKTMRYSSATKVIGVAATAQWRSSPTVPLKASSPVTTATKVLSRARSVFFDTCETRSRRPLRCPSVESRVEQRRYPFSR